jgi:hypothetical protein
VIKLDSIQVAEEHQRGSNMSEGPEPDRGYASTSNLIARVVTDIRAAQAAIMRRWKYSSNLEIV